jgi:hypothetical protein
MVYVRQYFFSTLFKKVTYEYIINFVAFMFYVNHIFMYVIRLRTLDCQAV